VAYLDISPILAAMREQPDAFSLSDGWLIHRASRHRFKVQADGHVIVDAARGCSHRSVRNEQGRQLYEALETWQAEHWIPREINRHFSSCIRPSGFWRRWLRKAAALWGQHRHDGALAIYAQAWVQSRQAAPRRDDEPPPPRPRKPDLPPPAGPAAKIRRERDKVTA
jgi:hypothetical protein